MIMSVSASLVDSSSFILQIDSLTVLLLSDNVLQWLQLPLTNYSYSMQSLCSKALHAKFSKLIFVSITNSKHIIIIPYTIVTKYILISFDYPLFNLKKSHFWLSLHITPAHPFFSASRLTWYRAPSSFSFTSRCFVLIMHCRVLYAKFPLKPWTKF